MAKPNQAKDVKPKAEEKEGASAESKFQMDSNMKVILINLVTTVLICVLFLSVSYVMQASLLNSKFSQTKVASTDDGTDATADNSTDDSAAAQHGIIVDLGDFILNLSDVAPRKYLKVAVSIEVSSKPSDADAAAPKKGEKEGGGAAAASPLDAEMAQYKPAIRDAIITNLSSKSSAELSTTAGKELAKDQITEAVNGIFAGDRDVIRVSFGDFIIQ